ncbi:MAG: hypothetical protein JKY22_01390 [Flavobacteriaceae bacterium]|nr:hypothetical protein [Flavobacteriaceae bacterium]
MKLPMYFNRMLKLFVSKLSIFCFALVALMLFSCNEGGDYAKIPAPVDFSPNIPVDVDPALQDKLKEDQAIYQLNEAFNMYSWQTFVAIQWPLDESGAAKPNFTDKGTSAWLGWKEAFQVYRADGQKPAPWGAPRTASGLGLPTHLLNDAGSRVVLSGKTPTHPSNFNIADEVDQAFAGELFDQNGNLVVYEVLMNKEEFDYVVDNSLYNINGQINYSEKNDSIANFPKGNYEKNELGAIEIKFAWKVLEAGDIKERYYRDEGYVIGPDNVLVKKDLGMIGMHISQKTPTGKQWVWSTFEHIDNLRQNVIEKDGKKVVIHPTLRNPDCEICPANLDLTNSLGYEFIDDNNRPYWLVKTLSPNNNADTISTKYFAPTNIKKTQVKRMVDIPVRVANINKMMQEYFKQQNSVWQYYELIDTQYPLNQNILPAPNLASNYVLPTSVTNKPGGDPNIALLTNLTMETFFQIGGQSASNLMEGNPASDIGIFGTESCMGCHSSAGIYDAYYFQNNTLKTKQAGQTSGDFSWLLGKAQWNQDSIPTNNN